ncbi:hypothetical protein GCM10025877_32250 [Agromyces mangrovi Wang et al. 2018]|nr:hypothetical protein GCM10025877_32250 [Agromyces mangrovi]
MQVRERAEAGGCLELAELEQRRRGLPGARHVLLGGRLPPRVGAGLAVVPVDGGRPAQDRAREAQVVAALDAHARREQRAIPVPGVAPDPARLVRLELGDALGEAVVGDPLDHARVEVHDRRCARRGTGEEELHRSILACRQAAARPVSADAGSIRCMTTTQPHPTAPGTCTTGTGAAR